jgi:hypothetical protein
VDWKIKEGIEAALREEGFEVEVTLRPKNRYTISGKDDQVRGASRWLEQKGFMRPQFHTDHFLTDDELGETFAYLEAL